MKTTAGRCSAAVFAMILYVILRNLPASPSRPQNDQILRVPHFPLSLNMRPGFHKINAIKAAIWFLLFAFPFPLSAQTADEYYSHEQLQFSLQPPPYFRVKEDLESEKQFQGTGLINRESITIRFELVDKAEFKREKYRQIAKELVAFPSELNENLAARKGIPPRFIDRKATNTFKLIAWVEYDAAQMARIEYFWFQDDPAWMRDSVLKYFRTFRLEKPQNYTPASEDVTFYDPVSLAPEELPPVNGKLGKKFSRGAFQPEGGTGRIYYSDFRPALASLSNGKWVLGWIDGDGNSRLQMLSENLKPEKQIQLADQRIIALEGMESGFVGIVARPSAVFPKDYDEGWLMHWDENLEVKWKVKLVGTSDYNKTNEQWLCNSADYHDLHASGKYLAVYLATYRHCPDGRNHQGDWLKFFDKDGKMVDGENYLARWDGWTWEVSHSFGQELASDEEAFLGLAVGDANPRGLAFFRGYPLTMDPGGKKMVKAKNVWKINGENGDNFVHHTRIAGFYSDGKMSTAGFLSSQGIAGASGKNTDPGLLRIAPDGTRKFARYVHSSPQRIEVNASLIPYGKNWLFVYSTLPLERSNWWLGFQDHYLLVDDQGKKIEGPVDFETFLPQQFKKSQEFSQVSETRYLGTKMVQGPSGDWLRIRPLADGLGFEWLRVQR